MRTARGSWQEKLAEELLSPAGLVTGIRPIRDLRGKALSYADRYVASLGNLLGRMQDQGFTIVWKPGRLGGLWGATFRVLRCWCEACVWYEGEGCAKRGVDRWLAGCATWSYECSENNICEAPEKPCRRPPCPSWEPCGGWKVWKKEEWVR